MLVLTFASGCATIVKDDSQPVAFSSDPQGSTVSINGIPRETTPTTMMIKRQNQAQMVTFELTDYHPVTFKLEKSMAGMVWGNIIFGGVVGAVVDASSGKGINYEDSVHVKMIPLSEPPPIVNEKGQLVVPDNAEPEETMDSVPSEQASEESSQDSTMDPDTSEDSDTSEDDALEKEPDNP